MKKAILLIGSFLLLLLACTIEKQQSFLTTDNIRTQTFSIDPLKENRIVGARGGIFIIPAGAFEGTGSVTIELKEVYAPIEILAAGLTTESNGQLLESGGMFYMNAKREGKELELKKEINGSIPSNYINDSMKLFKGEVEEVGNVNWVDPVPIQTDTTPNTNCIETGKRLFLTNCASCHAVNTRLTGPAIAGADSKVPRQLYYDFIHNPAKTAMKSSYYSHLIAEYEGIIMTGFPGLSNKDIDCIIEYTNSGVNGPTLLTQPCGFDTIFIDEDFEMVRRNAFARRNNDSEPLIEMQNDKLLETDTITPIIQERYSFEINTFGWYNIDIFIKEMEGIDDVTLSATTDFSDKELIDITLYLPDKRVFGSGYYNSKLARFTFGTDETKTPLFIGDLAIIFSLARKDNQIFYNVQEFRVTKSQSLKISMQETTEEKLQEAFEKINLDNINLDRLTKKPIVVPIPCNDSTHLPAK
jgi:hypothetical protein